MPLSPLLDYSLVPDASLLSNLAWFFSIQVIIQQASLDEILGILSLLFLVLFFASHLDILGKLTSREKLCN